MYKIVIIILSLAAFKAQSVSHLLDTSFGTKGLTGLISPHGGTTIEDIVQLDNEKVIFVGHFDNKWFDSFTNGFLVGRLNSNGTLDTSFANKGYLDLTQLIVNEDRGPVAKRVFLSENGGFYIVGYREKINEEQDRVHSVFISKHLDNGQLDSSFGEEGIRDINELESFTWFFGFEAFIDSQERITASGWYGMGADSKYLVSRVTSDGDIDSSFGEEGLIQISLETSFTKENGDVVPMQLKSFNMASNNDKFIAVSRAQGDSRDFTGADEDFTKILLHVFSSDGELEKNAYVSRPDRDFSPLSVVKLDSSNHISIISLSGSTYAENKGSILKFDTNGEFISIFGSEGVAYFQIPDPNEGYGHFTIRDFVLLSDGSYSVVGSRTHSDKFLFTFNVSNLGRLEKISNIDTGNTQMLSGSIESYMTKDNGLLIYGSYRGNSTFAKLNLAGEIQDSFMSNGRSYVAHFRDIRDIELKNDGSLLLAGYGTVHESRQGSTTGLISKLHSNGKIDNSFGENGYASTTIDHNASDLGSSEVIFDIEELPNGNIVAVGIFRPSENLQTEASDNLFVTRYTPDGLVDYNFGDSGVFNFDPTIIQEAEFTSVLGNSIEILSDDSLIVAGTISEYHPGRRSGILIKLSSSGKIDTSFGNEGIILLEDDIGLTSLYSVTKSGNDEIVAAGIVLGETGYDMLAVKLNASGQFDMEFGQNGIAILGSEVEDEKALAIESTDDGKFYLIGSRLGITNSNSTEKLAYIIRISEKGVLDTSFGNQGGRAIDWGKVEFHRSNSALDLNITPQGNLLVSGYADFDSWDRSSSIALAALKTDGSLINSFGENGILNLHFGSSTAWKVLPVSESSLVFAGSSGTDIGIVTKLSGYNLNTTSSGGEDTNDSSSSNSSGGGGSFLLIVVVLCFAFRRA